MSKFIPREQRLEVWHSQAYAREKARGLSVIAAGALSIRATFGPCYTHHIHKLAVERAMKRGAANVMVRGYYGNIALLCPKDIDGALQAIERKHRSEARNRQLRQRNGLPIPSPADEQRFNHARLFLRWYRRYGDPKKFAALIDTLTTSPFYRLEAAE